jgi:hypothetical protein
MRITNLTFLAFYLNGALDTGKYADVSFDEVGKAIDNGTIFDVLAKRLEGDSDLSIFDAAKKAEIIAEWQDHRNAVNARRKLGVENNGLCLLVAYCLEGVQRRQDSNPGL